MQVNDNNAGKSKQAAYKLCFCEFFLPEQKACDQDGQKGGGASDDCGFHCGGVRKANIKKQILGNRLDEGQFANARQGGLLRKKKPFFQYAADKNGKRASKSKTKPREKDLRGGVP